MHVNKKMFKGDPHGNAFIFYSLYWAWERLLDLKFYEDQP